MKKEFDVLGAIKSLQERLYKLFGDLHKAPISQHEKHLTWMQSYYYPEKLEEPEKERNRSFVLGYRIGKAEMASEFDRGYEAAMVKIKQTLESHQ